MYFCVTKHLPEILIIIQTWLSKGNCSLKTTKENIKIYICILFKIIWLLEKFSKKYQEMTLIMT